MTQPDVLNPSGVSSLFKKPWVLYAGFLCLLGFGYLLWWPIEAGDTDLWFHLDYWRYFFAHHSIPHDTYFSFLSPPIGFVNHSWLFQVVVYSVYSWEGYYGLLALRAILYLATVTLVFRFLFKHDGHHQPFLWLTTLGVLVSLPLLIRDLLVRPHLFSYGCIILMLFILEYHRHRAILLPLLVVLWCNLHGAMFPVMLWILGSYSLEYLVGRLRHGSYLKENERTFFVPVVLSMASIFLTPHGLRLLRLPLFQSMAYESQAILELHQPLDLENLFSVHIWALVPSQQTMINLLLLASWFAVITACVRKQVRISHLCLWIGGLLLFMKGVRFAHECALLSLPVLKANVFLPRGDAARQVPKPVRLMTIGMLMAMPVMFVQGRFLHRARYPFSSSGLPQGVVTFLNRIDARGPVLNHPNPGGYLRWILYPRYQIFLDMEFPGIPIEYFHLIKRAFVDEGILRKLVSQYDPSFIMVPLALGEFKKVIQQFPDYVLVFFDDVSALYVNARQYPTLAQEYTLKEVDLFALIQKGVEEVIAEREKAPIIRYLPRLLDMYPDSGITNHLAAASYNADGAYDRALPHAETIIRNFPDSPKGYVLKGDALNGLRVFDQAIASYQMALKRAGADNRRHIYRKMGMAYREERQYPQAYKALAKSIDVFSPKTPRKDLCELASTARLAGKTKEAQAIMTYLDEFMASPTSVACEESDEHETSVLIPSPGTS